MTTANSRTGKPFSAVERDEAVAEIGRLRSAQEVLRAISGTMEVEALLELLGKKILEIASVDGFVMNVLDMAGENLVCMNLRYPEEFRHLEETFLHYKFPLSQPSPHAMAFLQQRVIAIDHDTCSDEERVALDHWRLRHMVVVPISAPAAVPTGKVMRVGTVMVLCQRSRLSSEEVEALEDLIRLFRVPLCNAQKYAHLRQQQAAFESAATEQERFLRFVTEVNSLTHPDRIFELILIELMNRLSFDLASVFIEKNGLLECRKTVAKHERHGPVAETLQDYCAREPYMVDIYDGGPPHSFIKNIPLVFKDVQQIMHLELPRKSRAALTMLQTARTLVNMPIRFKGQPIGVVMLISMEEPVHISEADFKFFELLSSFFGTAITNANTYALADEQRREIGRLNLILQDKINELADQVATDKLTGLYNFRTFEQELFRRMNEYQRASVNQGLSIVMVDIDHFKRFNDNYGHAAGNFVLAGVAKEIAKLSRKMDLACRYGGEEFVVILPKCNADGALIFAERLRIAIENARFEIEAGVLGVTVSIGVATFADGDSQQSLFERADQALYRAKRGGRNQVCA